MICPCPWVFLNPGFFCAGCSLAMIALICKELILSQLQLGFGESQMLDKLLYEEEVKRCVICFEQQFHYTPFYAYMKLREQVSAGGKHCHHGQRPVRIFLIMSPYPYP